MANKIQVKRGNSTGFGPLNLQPGEPAFLLDTGKLYIGNGATKVCINPDVVPFSKRLEVGRDIALQGDATGKINFDGSSNVIIPVTLANSGVTAGSGYGIISVDSKGRVTSARPMTYDDIPALDLKKITDAGTVANKNVGTSAGQIPILGNDGKLDVSVLPALSICDTYVVASQAEMLTLSKAERGDIAVRSDLKRSFILKDAPASKIENWQELLTPTDTILSVNGKVGNVILYKADVGLDKVDNTADIDKPISRAAQSALDLKAPINSPTFTGTAKAPTVASADSSDNIATTAFVKAQNYMILDVTVVDGGTF